jgi:hypothetical protein
MTDNNSDFFAFCAKKMKKINKYTFCFEFDFLLNLLLYNFFVNLITDTRIFHKYE